MTRPDVQRVDAAVLLTPAAVSILVSGLAALEQLAGQRGARLTPALQAICAQLDEAAAPTDAGTDAYASTPVPRGEWLPLSAHDLLDTDEAAAMLGCSPSNVRDLAAGVRYPRTAAADGGCSNATPCSSAPGDRGIR